MNLAELHRVAVLASGEGTNLQALIDHVHGHDGIEIVGVLGSKAAIGALGRAEAAGIETAVFSKDDFATREARDRAMAEWIAERNCGLAVTAGWMQLLTEPFLESFPDRVVNVHPSLLPDYPGIDAVGQAIAAGASRTGVTIHLVDAGVDTGRVLLQEAIDLPAGSTVDSAMKLIRPLEHRLLSEAVRGLVAGRLA